MQDELRKQYLDSLPARLDSLKALVKSLRDGDQAAEDKIRMIAHSLYGSGATFGYPEISAASKKVEHAAAADLLKQLPELLTVLKDIMAKAAAEPSRVRSILLIEDDAENAALIKAIARRKFPGYHVDVAASATQAQEFLVKHTYSLIILDLILPDRDGREVLREIRVDFQLSTPVLVLTGVNKDVVRIECMSLGADKVLLKPFEEDRLLPVIEVLLKKSDKQQLTLVPKGNELKEQVSQDGVRMDLSGMNVLVAEDDTVQANLIRQRLIQEGLAVQNVSNGREAMAALRLKEFSLVILDVKMPLFNGFEVLERIRGELGLNELPVILLTAMGSEADIIHGYDLGADDYILKPFSLVQLVARVKSLLKKPG